ncbi:MAG: stage V sporulation protein S [Anaerolineaceae bacterium]|nr:stage V sporulation protein S [Anaerolineaceae bacterium]
MSDDELYDDYTPLDDISSQYASHYHSDDDSSKPDIIKVSARSRSTAVAGAIAGVIREHHYAEVQAIGAGAVNQAVKALAIARGYLTRDEIDIVFTPFFTEVTIDGQERTAVRFTVEPR